MADVTVDADGQVRLHPVLARVIVQQTQAPEALIDAELDRYLRLLCTTPDSLES